MSVSFFSNGFQFFLLSSSVGDDCFFSMLTISSHQVDAPQGLLFLLIQESIYLGINQVKEEEEENSFLEDTCSILIKV